jgi:hypothetical protein
MADRMPQAALHETAPYPVVREPDRREDEETCGHDDQRSPTTIKFFNGDGASGPASSPIPDEAPATNLDVWTEVVKVAP